MKKSSLLLMGTIVIVSFLYSCVATSSTMVSVIKPADINVPGHIKRLGIVDRSHPDKSGKAINIIEGMFSGESIYQDKYSANEAMGGVIFELSKTERFTVYQIQGVTLTNNGSTSFSPILSWELIKELCLKNKVDALVVLEVFDTNKNLNWRTENQSIVKNGITQNQIMHIANMTTEVVTGWRIYDPSNQTIVDEWRVRESKSSSARGITQYDAETALPQYTSVVGELARKNGETYGLRIAPIAIMVSRYFYTGGNPVMQDARTFIQSQNYSDAVKSWEAIYNSTEKPKIRARAAHNIAVACEIDGQLDKAIEWANRAIELGNKNSKYYLRTLEQRKIDDVKAKQQLQSVEEEK
ncbi:MAG: DUF6340 family protein [Bacteroidetes bacterium]|nr:DUF6340 family protein [Bacteroidota bacterium]